MFFSQLRETLEQNAALSAEHEKLSRDKVGLISELDETKLQLKRFDKESSIVSHKYIFKNIIFQVKKCYFKHIKSSNIQTIQWKYKVKIQID